MFFRRGMAGDDRWLQAKMWLFSVGALLALLGMFLENDWVMGAAGVVLLVGFLLRFAGGGEDEEPDEGGSPTDTAGGGDREDGPVGG